MMESFKFGAWIKILVAVFVYLPVRQAFPLRTFSEVRQATWLLCGQQVPREGPKFPATWGLKELRPWQAQIDAIVSSQPEGRTIHWLFDDQTYWGGRGKGSLMKDWMVKRNDTMFSVQDFVTGGTIDTIGKSLVACRLARASRHGRRMYSMLNLIPPNCHVVVMCSFWPDKAQMPEWEWRLWEWDDDNMMHRVPDDMDMGGRVGLSNTHAKGEYVNISSFRHANTNIM